MSYIPIPERYKAPLRDHKRRGRPATPDIRMEIVKNGPKLVCRLKLPRALIGDADRADVLLGVAGDVGTLLVVPHDNGSRKLCRGGADWSVYLSLGPTFTQAGVQSVTPCEWKVETTLTGLSALVVTLPAWAAQE